MKSLEKVRSVFRVLTPSGRGAVATIWLSGEDLDPALDRMFLPANKRTFSKSRVGEILYGQWQTGASAGEDVVVTRICKNTAEIHSHGGNSVTSAISNILSEIGFEELTNSEATGQIQGDPWLGEIQLALAAASTQKTALILLEQLNVLPRTIDSIITSLNSADTESARRAIVAILDREQFGRHLTQPWSVVLFGAPNVGKSSLINAIVGFNRAIVHDTPGTTRDSVSELTAIDGWPVNITDTAGLRVATDEIEAQGIRRAEAMMANADLLVHVREASSNNNATSTDVDVSERCSAKVVHVRNKADLMEPGLLGKMGDALAVSAKTGFAVAELVSRIGSELVEKPPGPADAIPVCPEQVTRLTDALTEIESGNFERAIRKLRSSAV